MKLITLKLSGIERLKNHCTSLFSYLLSYPFIIFNVIIFITQFANMDQKLCCLKSLL